MFSHCVDPVRKKADSGENRGLRTLWNVPVITDLITDQITVAGDHWMRPAARLNQYHQSSIIYSPGSTWQRVKEGKMRVLGPVPTGSSGARIKYRSFFSLRVEEQTIEVRHNLALFEMKRGCFLFLFRSTVYSFSKRDFL